MITYLVRLADRTTGEGQRILVYDKNPDLDMQSWIDTNKGDFVPPLLIDDPVVMTVHELKIKRPVGKTALSTATKVAV